MKRSAEDILGPDRRSKRPKANHLGRLEQLSDELLLHVLSFLPLQSLTLCQRLSRRFGTLSCDSQIWKDLYYDRFIHVPRLQQPRTGNRTHNSDASRSVARSKKSSEDPLALKRGRIVDWKRQYRLRDNWSSGACHVRHIEIAKQMSNRPILACMSSGKLFTADIQEGLRIWSTGSSRQLLCKIELLGDNQRAARRRPTTLSISESPNEGIDHLIIITFDDGGFAVYESRYKSDPSLCRAFEHPPSSEGSIHGAAFLFPFFITITDSRLLSLYRFDEPEREALPESLKPPRLLNSLRSQTLRKPMSLSLRTHGQMIIAAIAYAVPTLFSNWLMGVQELRFASNGNLLASRVASSADGQYQPLLSTKRKAVPEAGENTSRSYIEAEMPQPTSVSYSHPYLLVPHSDNTLTLYLVSSTNTHLSIGQGSRLWGHTSAVSGAHVGSRGKAVSVSGKGEELRVWELEGGMASFALRQRLATGELSVRVQPDTRAATAGSNSRVGHGCGQEVAVQRRIDEESVARGWIGFDEESVALLRQSSRGGQAVVVYDFS